MSQGNSQGQEDAKGQGPGARGQGFRALLAWQRAHELALAVFRATQSLQRSHDWLVRQSTRSAVSVAANIAEGFSRASLRDYIRYLNISRGSLAETEYYLIFMHDAGLFSSETTRELQTLRIEAGNLPFGLLRSLETKERAQRQSNSRIKEGQAEYAAELGSDEGALGPRPMALGPSDPRPATRTSPTLDAAGRS